MAGKKCPTGTKFPERRKLDLKSFSEKGTAKRFRSTLNGPGARLMGFAEKTPKSFWARFSPFLGRNPASLGPNFTPLVRHRPPNAPEAFGHYIAPFTFLRPKSTLGVPPLSEMELFRSLFVGNGGCTNSPHDSNFRRIRQLGVLFAFLKKGFVERFWGRKRSPGAAVPRRCGAGA